MIEQDTEILFNRMIASETFLLGLKSPEIVATAKPGQFVMVRVSSGIDPLLRRPFSICGIKEKDQFLILYRVVGQGTAILAEKKEGEKLSVLGPLGKGFVLPETHEIPLLVGGGIGVAPLFFLSQTMKATDIEFMMGFGSSNEIIDMKGIVVVNANVSMATDDGTAGHNGPVTDLLEEYLKKNIARKDALSLFTCGPIPMLKRVVDIAINGGISCQSSMEAFMACGLGACQGCAIKAASKESRDYYHVCRDGPVIPIQSLDWKSIKDC